MKKITGGLLAILLGEFLVLSHKDKKFKATVKKKKGREKIEYIFTSLFQFNKALIDEAGEEIGKIDIHEKVALWKEKAEKEYTLLVKKIDDLEDKVGSYTEKDITKIIKELKTRYSTLLTKVQKIAEELDEKYDLEKKVVAIKKHIDTLQKRSKKA